MANGNDDLGVVVVIAAGVLMYFWWQQRPSVAVTGATAGSGSTHGRGGRGTTGCGCHDTGAPVSNGGLVNNQNVVAPAGAVSTASGLPGNLVRAHSFLPNPVPGSVGSTSGSGANWTSLNSASAVGTTPRNAPAAPQSPSGAGIWVANSTPARVRG